MTIERVVRRADAVAIEAIDVDDVIDRPDERPQWVRDAIEHRALVIIDDDRHARIAIKNGQYAGTALRGDKLCYDPERKQLFYVNRRDFLRYFVPRAQQDEASAE